MQQLPAYDQRTYGRMSKGDLQSAYIADGLFCPGEIILRHWETDRTIIGGAMPLGRALPLPVPEHLRAEHFNDRRELGVINIGGEGTVQVDGRKYQMGKLDTLYIGRGAKKVVFASRRRADPACYYLLSYPAHASYPTKLAPRAKVPGIPLGAEATHNSRTLYRVIHKDGIQSCQLVMGFTMLAPGSKWNTMPPHTHLRRSEVYLYFDLPAGEHVTHFMGPAERIRKLTMRNRQAVLSPPWSVHCGVGTTNYTFIWGMGGENQDYADMDPVDPKLIR